MKIKKNYILWGLAIILIIIISLCIILLKPYKLENQESVKIYDRYGELLYDVRDEYRQTNYETINDVPDFLLEFLVKKEDKRFWEHHWVDFRAIARALKVSIWDWHIQWASTIDQQVIKLSQQAFSRNITQKVREIILAWNINIHYNKDEILLYYVNNLYFPNGVKWFRTACQVYFGQTCEDLDRGHLVYLYAKTKYPSMKKLAEYSFFVADRFGLEDYKLENFEKIENEAGFFVKNKARFFVNWILDSHPGGNLKTNFDTILYEKIQNTLDLMAPYLNWKNAQNMCIIVLENWELASMNVYPNFGKDYINGCLRPRQVGSAIKPFLYTLAFEQLNYDENTKINDETISFEWDYGNYTPNNFDMDFHGKVSLATALGNSLNIPAIKLLDKVWNENFYYFLSDIGHLVETDEKWNDDIQNYGLALGLGVKELSPLDFTKMWTIFNLCEQNSNLLDISINKKTEIDFFCKKYWDELLEVKNILSQNHNRLISFGQYNRFDILWSYSKSWTSRHFIDGRICGGTGPYSVCMRAGNYSTKPMLWGGHEVVWPIWYEIINKLTR